jgi:non-heme chloroperoxidase
VKSCGGCEGRRRQAGGAPAWLAIVILLAVTALASPATAQPTDRTFVTSDGVRLHYLLAGAEHDHTIVLVPGWTMPGWIFQVQVAALSAQYRVIAFDPRGQGQSEIADQGYDQNRRGQDIAELIREVDPQPVLLVGWSLGVLDSLAYVARSGDSHIAGLVLVDNSVGETPAPNAAPPPKSPVRGPKRSATCTRAFVVGMFNTPQSADYLDHLASDCGRTPAPIARALLAYPVPRTYWRDALYSTDKPVLYIVRPRLEPQALNLVRNRPNAETVLFPTAGHALFVDEPERFNAVVRDFIERRVWPSHPAP